MLICVISSFLASSNATDKVSLSTFLKLIFSSKAFLKIASVLFFVLIVTVSKKFSLKISNSLLIPSANNFAKVEVLLAIFNIPSGP